MHRASIRIRRGYVSKNIGKDHLALALAFHIAPRQPFFEDLARESVYRKKEDRGEKTHNQRTSLANQSDRSNILCATTQTDVEGEIEKSRPGASDPFIYI